AIQALTLEELKRYDVGRLKPGTAYAERFPGQRPVDLTRIPTLEELFAFVAEADAPHVRFNIETKITPAWGREVPPPDVCAEAVAAVVRKAGLVPRVTVQSFDWRTLVVLQRIAPEIERVCLTDEQPDDDTIRRNRPGRSPWTAGLDVHDF